MNDDTRVAYLIAGVLTVVTAFVSYDSFHTASVILYDNPFILPAATTFIIAVLSFGGVFAYPYLEKPAQRVVDAIRNDFDSTDELDTESWRKK